jgi:hypothetical protein
VRKKESRAPLPGAEVKLELGQMGLDIKKRITRPHFEPPPAKEDVYYLAVRATSITPRWAGMLAMEGYRWAPFFHAWIYDRHGNGTRVGFVEAAWLQKYLSQATCGALVPELHRGLCVKPKEGALPEPRGAAGAGRQPAAGGDLGGAGGVRGDPRLQAQGPPLQPEGDAGVAGEPARGGGVAEPH